MRILYVANHNAGGNCDEQAIAYALEALGHDVVRLPETMHNPTRIIEFVGGGDLLLFHKWDNSYRPPQRKIPQVFWYFDLVQWYDPTLEARCRNRVKWMNEAVRNVEIGFCTDGDWVAQDTTGKLVWLPQGADERVVGAWGEHTGEGPEPEGKGVLFTGISKGGGTSRVAFVERMKAHYKDRFTHVPRGVHRRDLARLIARHAVYVCPDSPTTLRYWSNRIYNAAGYGAFVVHPWCGDLLGEQYRDERELRYYENENHLLPLIDHYLHAPRERAALGAAALRRTREMHLYRHRCEEMLRVVKERLGVG